MRAIAAVVAAGGSAFTAGNTIPYSQLGYGEGTVTGANPTNVAYALDTGKTDLNTVTYTVPANPNYAQQVATIGQCAPLRRTMAWPNGTRSSGPPTGPFLA